MTILGARSINKHTSGQQFAFAERSYLRVQASSVNVYTRMGSCYGKTSCYIYHYMTLSNVLEERGGTA